MCSSSRCTCAPRSSYLLQLSLLLWTQFYTFTYDRLILPLYFRWINVHGRLKRHLGGNRLDCSHLFTRSCLLLANWLQSHFVTRITRTNSRDQLLSSEDAVTSLSFSLALALDSIQFNLYQQPETNGRECKFVDAQSVFYLDPSIVQLCHRVLDLRSLNSTLFTQNTGWLVTVYVYSCACCEYVNWA